MDTAGSKMHLLEAPHVLPCGHIASTAITTFVFRDKWRWKADQTNLDLSPYVQGNDEQHLNDTCPLYTLESREI